jgi:uncharacterized membrane protein (DUF4010 family)
MLGVIIRRVALDQIDPTAVMTDLMLPSDLQRLVVALLIGALIGLDRERSEERKAHQLFGGVRTFPLIALAGAIPMLLIDRTGPSLLIVSFLAVVAVTLVAYVRTSVSGDVGATTEIAAFATFLLGVLAGAGYMHVAAAAGIGVAILLVAKPRIEGFSRALTADELAATLELAVISVIILPLLPNQGYGPWSILNPFDIWLMVVLVSGLSFAGFVAMRLWGERQGLAIASTIGALVSSTAVTMAMAARSRTDTELARSAASAAVLASTVMSIRVAVLAGIVNLGVLPRLLPVVGAMVVVGAIAAWLLSHNEVKRTHSVASTSLTNPFSLREALGFGTMYAVVLIGAHAAQEYFGPRGAYAAAMFSAVVDVDAVTIAFTQRGPGLDAWQSATAAITVAVVTNTLVKLGIACATGGTGFRRPVSVALGVMALVGAGVGLVAYRYY